MTDESTENIPSHQSESTLLGLQPRETWEPSRLIGQTWSDRIKEQSLFSARTTSRSYLDALRKKLAAIASRQVIPDVADKALRSCLTDLGYRPETGFPDNDGRIPPATPGSITDLSSSRRIQLIVDTNIKQARSMAQLASSENPVFLMTNPAWKLTRTGVRKKPRGDWRDRWRAAGDSVGWKGASKTQMVALKTSPIWRAIGDGAGGFTDTIMSSFPPFAFGSGMAWVNVGRREWKRICEAEGMDDGLTDLKEKTLSASKAAKTPLEPRAIPVDKVGGRTLQRGYTPSNAAFNAANENIHRATAEATLIESEIANGLARIKRKANDLGAVYDEAESYEASDFVKSVITDLEKAKTDIVAARERLQGYQDGLTKVKKPTNPAEQMKYDAQMGSVSDAATKVLRIIRTSRQTLMAKLTAAMKVCKGDLEAAAKG